MKGIYLTCFGCTILFAQENAFTNLFINRLTINIDQLLDLKSTPTIASAEPASGRIAAELPVKAIELNCPNLLLNKTESIQTTEREPIRSLQPVVLQSELSPDADQALASAQTPFMVITELSPQCKPVMPAAAPRAQPPVQPTAVEQ